MVVAFPEPAVGGIGGLSSHGSGSDLRSIGKVEEREIG
jgi:hypothetical protein